MSEAELHILKQRMHQGRLNKAQRGDLQFALPVGYVWSLTGEIQFDPDEQVQQGGYGSSSANLTNWGRWVGWCATWPGSRSNSECACERVQARGNWSGGVRIERRYK